MKNLNVFMMCLASFAMISVSSCQNPVDNGGEKKPTEVTLSISGGSNVEVLKADITKDITIKASSTVTEDVVVKVTTDGAPTEAVLETANVTIKKGTDATIAKITFKAAAFPQGTASKPIVVTVSTTADNVTVDEPSTTFNVKGEKGEDPLPEIANITISPNKTSYNTTIGAENVTYTITLSNELENAVKIQATVDPSSAEYFKTAFGSIPEVTIAAGTKSGTIGPLNVPESTEGTLKMNFTAKGENATLTTQEITSSFSFDKPKFSLERTGEIEKVEVPLASDANRTFVAKLDRAAKTDVTINLAVTSTTVPTGTLSANLVTITKGSLQSSPVTISFSKNVFTSPSVQATVTVTGTCTTVEATTAAISWEVAGMATLYSIESEMESELFVGSTDVTRTFDVKLSQALGTDLNVYINRYGVGTAPFTLTENGVALEWGESPTMGNREFVVIPVGETTITVTMTFLGSWFSQPDSAIGFELRSECTLPAVEGKSNLGRYEIKPSGN